MTGGRTLLGDRRGSLDMPAGQGARPPIALALEINPLGPEVENPFAVEEMQARPPRGAHPANNEDEWADHSSGSFGPPSDPEGYMPVEEQIGHRVRFRHRAGESESDHSSGSSFGPPDSDDDSAQPVHGSRSRVWAGSEDLFWDPAASGFQVQMPGQQQPRAVAGDSDSYDGDADQI